jgi:amidase
MARTVEDCALLLNVMSEPSGNTAASSALSAIDFTQNLDRDFKQVKIAISADFNGQLPVDAKIRDVVKAAASTFNNMGCVVSEDCPDFTGADEVFKTLRAWMCANTHRDDLAAHRDLYKDTLIWNAEQGMELTGEDIFNAEKTREKLFQRVQRFLEDFEFLILPVTQTPPFDINKEYVDTIDGQKMHTYIDWMKSCYYISATGLPAISVPAGFTDTGLPVGIQIVGRHHQDHAVLQLAKAFESETKYGQQLPHLLK